MRIVITGHLGYVGAVVMRHLRMRYSNAVLVGFDSGLFADCLTGPSRPEDVLDRQIMGDIRDVDGSLFDGADAVVHLAAISNDPMGVRFEQVTDEINHRASVRCAMLARDAGVANFVFASSCSVYGVAGGAPRRETDAVAPLTAYARSKYATEIALRAADTGAMNVTCLRFATAAGASDRLRLDLVLNDFVASALATGWITVLSDGTPWRPLIDVADMARAIEWAIGRDRGNGGAFLSVNAGSDSWNVRVRDLAAAVAATIGGVAVSVNADAPPDRRSYQVDFSLFRALAPGHQPVMGLLQSIQHLQRLLGSLGFTDADFRSGRLIRLKTLEHLIHTGQILPDLRALAGLALAA